MTMSTSNMLRVQTGLHWGIALTVRTSDKLKMHNHYLIETVAAYEASMCCIVLTNCTLSSLDNATTAEAKLSLLCLFACCQSWLLTIVQASFRVSFTSL